jgi:hypothetical protein
MDSGTYKGNLSVSGRPWTAQCLTLALSHTSGRRSGSRHPADFTSTVVLLVNAGHRMCGRRYGRDHRPALITKAYKPVILAHRLGTFLGVRGTPERAGFSPLGWPIQDHLQLIPLPSSAPAAVPSDGAESMIEASVSANGASLVDSQFEPIQKPSTAVSFSP